MDHKDQSYLGTKITQLNNLADYPEGKINDNLCKKNNKCLSQWLKVVLKVIINKQALQ